jgi:hypothetical protein
LITFSHRNRVFYETSKKANDEVSVSALPLGYACSLLFLSGTIGGGGEWANKQSFIFHHLFYTFLTHFILQKHIPYLPNYKNPCWYERDHLAHTVVLKCLPYALVVGFEKSGTTELHNKLSLHPQVEAPFRKEPFYWGHNGELERGARGGGGGGWGLGVRSDMGGG